MGGPSCNFFHRGMNERIPSHTYSHNNGMYVLVYSMYASGNLARLYAYQGYEIARIYVLQHTGTGAEGPEGTGDRRDRWEGPEGDS